MSNFFFNLFSNNSSIVLNLPETPPIMVRGRYTTVRMNPTENTAVNENVEVVPKSNENTSIIKRMEIADIGKRAALMNKFNSQLFPPKNL